MNNQKRERQQGKEKIKLKAKVSGNLLLQRAYKRKKHNIYGTTGKLAKSQESNDLSLSANSTLFANKNARERKTEGKHENKMRLRMRAIRQRREQIYLRA